MAILICRPYFFKLTEMPLIVMTHLRFFVFKGENNAKSS